MGARSHGPLLLIRFLAIASVLATAVSFAPRLALAVEPRSRVALVRTSGSDRLLREATTRLRAELSDAGFDVIEVNRPPGDEREGVESAEGATDSFATVSMNRTGSGASADVWISDHVTGKTVVRRLRVDAAPNAAAVLAIRALELLRASLLEVAVPEQPASESRAAPPPDVLHWVEPSLPAATPHRASPFRGTLLGVGALAVHGTSGLGVAIGPAIRLSMPVAGAFFGRLSLAGPLLAGDVSTDQGSASVRQELAALDFGWASVANPVGVFVWAGVGAFDLHVSGSAMGPYRARSEGVLSFLSNAGVGGVVRAGERIGFTAEFMVISLVPQPVVVIADRDSGKAGAPSFGLSLGVIVTL